MKDDTTVVKIKFYDHELGREQEIYREVKESKIMSNHHFKWI